MMIVDATSGRRVAEVLIGAAVMLRLPIRP
ncbi:hypothetical protein QFZ91_002513 [Paraburkholderia sp. JPY419]